MAIFTTLKNNSNKRYVVTVDGFPLNSVKSVKSGIRLCYGYNENDNWLRYDFITAVSLCNFIKRADPLKAHEYKVEEI